MTLSHGRLAGGAPSRGASARSPAGACSCRPSACSRRWPSSASPRPSSARWAGCRPTARRPRHVLDRYGLTARRRVRPGRRARARRSTREYARRAAAQLAQAGGELFVAAVVQDQAWSPPAAARRRRLEARRRRTSTRSRRSRREEGVELVLHPHVGTLAGDRGRTSSSRSRTRDVPWCLDTGHLLIGGVDPVAFATEHGDRIGHVHFKDVDARVAERCAGRAHAHAGRPARPVPASWESGDARIDEVVDALRRSGYERWLVLEQDLAITGSEPPVGGGSGVGCRHEHRVPFHLGSARRRSTDEATHRSWPRAGRCRGVRQLGRRHRQADGRAATPFSAHAGLDLTIAMVTHSDEGSFWSVVKKGAEQAAKDEGVKLVWSPSNNDPEKEAQLIDAAVSPEGRRHRGLASRTRTPSRARWHKATDAGIPIITLNSGADQFQALGAITHVGQDETIAGQAAGARFKDEGAKKVLCIIHEQGNIGLKQRCDGVKQGFGGAVENLQVKGTADVATTQTEIKSKLQADKSFDAVIALNPDIANAAATAIKGAARAAPSSPRSTSTRTSSSASRTARSQFAVDQQQYLQGYLPIVFLKLFKTNANTVGGGQPVLTGPGFVDKGNVDTVEKLAGEGTR